MKVWVAKWALSSGVIEVEGDMLASGILKVTQGGYLAASEFFLTRKEAVRKANDMRKRKIVSLKRKLELLESADFEKKDPFSKGDGQ